MAVRYYKPSNRAEHNGGRTLFTFIGHSNAARTSHALQKRHLSEVFEGQKWFEEGLMLDSLEKGVLFPLIHCTDLASHVQLPMLLLESSSMKPAIRLQQGVFTEIRKFVPSVVGNAPAGYRTETPFKAWILTGFKTLDSTFNDVLEDNWKEWTGARVIYLNLPEEFGLSRLSLYRRLLPEKDIDVFRYIMVAECDFVYASNKIKLLDYVQKLRVDRMAGYLSVYQVTRQIPSTAHLINGLLSEAVSIGGGEDETNI